MRRGRSGRPIRRTPTGTKRMTRLEAVDPALELLEARTEVVDVSIKSTGHVPAVPRASRSFAHGSTIIGVYEPEQLSEPAPSTRFRMS